MRLSIETNFPRVQRALDRLQAEVAQKAAARAVNRTMEQARTAMSQEIRRTYAIDARTVRERLSIKRASFFGGVLTIEATLLASDKPRAANVIRFSARQTAQGVTVKIRRDQPRKLLRGVFIGNKGRTVFQREPGTKMQSRKWGGQHGKRIKPVQTIDVPQMFNARRINAAVVAAMRAKFPAIFERELAFALSQFSRAK
jgi:hypothetical protein